MKCQKMNRKLLLNLACILPPLSVFLSLSSSTVRVMFCASHSIAQFSHDGRYRCVFFVTKTSGGPTLRKYACKTRNKNREYYWKKRENHRALHLKRKRAWCYPPPSNDRPRQKRQEKKHIVASVGNREMCPFFHSLFFQLF